MSSAPKELLSYLTKLRISAHQLYVELVDIVILPFLEKIDFVSITKIMLKIDFVSIAKIRLKMKNIF